VLQLWQAAAVAVCAAADYLAKPDACHGIVVPAECCSRRLPGAPAQR
jgi:hypothetical protein